MKSNTESITLGISEEKAAKMSIATRISLNYLRLLIAGAVIFILLFFYMFLSSAKHVYDDDADSLLVNIENGNYRIDTDFSQIEKPGMSIVIMDSQSGEVINDSGRQYNQVGTFIFDYSIQRINESFYLTARDSGEVFVGDKEYVVVFYYDLTKECKRGLRLSLNMTFLFTILLASIYFEGKKENEKILRPLRKMSGILERLSVTNLHSERFDIIGANDEIKDLAIVCNEMLDRLELSYESQKQFVSNASHELRTPIAVIQGYANMLNRWGAENPEILAESITALCNVSKEMQELVEKLLFLSRHDRRTLKLKKDWFDVREVVEDLIKEAEFVIAGRNIVCSELESVEIYGDKQMIKQAMRVFIDNAVKYTYENGTINIACKNLYGSCELTVQDDGIGMRKKDLDNIFERFYRSDDVRDKNISGHGLGLSIAKLIIMSHSGRIKIKTQYKKGTTFIVTLPRRR